MSDVCVRFVYDPIVCVVSWIGDFFIIFWVPFTSMIVGFSGMIFRCLGVCFVYYLCILGIP